MLTRLPERARVTKALIIILVVGICFVFAYIKDANASVRGQMKGKLFEMKSVELRRFIRDGIAFLALEFSNKDLVSQSCSQNVMTEGLLVEIPLSIQNGLPNYDEAEFKMLGSEAQDLPCFHKISLKKEDLERQGLLYVNGQIEVAGSKTNFAGNFTARVCN